MLAQSVFAYLLTEPAFNARLAERQTGVGAADIRNKTQGHQFRRRPVSGAK